MFAFLDTLVLKVLLTLYNTIKQWIILSFIQKTKTIYTLINNSGSCVSIDFNMWSSDTGLSLLRVVIHFLMKKLLELKTLLLRLLIISNHSGIEQDRLLLLFLKDYRIDHDKLGWYVLDNATNKDRTPEKLSKFILFIHKKKG